MGTLASRIEDLWALVSFLRWKATKKEPYLEICFKLIISQLLQLHNQILFSNMLSVWTAPLLGLLQPNLIERSPLLLYNYFSLTKKQLWDYENTIFFILEFCSF